MIFEIIIHNFTFRDLVLTEGGSINLASNNIRVITDYYVDKIEDYLIVDPPTSGRLIAVPSAGLDVTPKANEKTVTIFSTEDLDERRIKVSREAKCQFHQHFTSAFFIQKWFFAKT